MPQIFHVFTANFYIVSVVVWMNKWAFCFGVLGFLFFSFYFVDFVLHIR